MSIGEYGLALGLAMAYAAQIPHLISTALHILTLLQHYECQARLCDLVHHALMVTIKYPTKWANFTSRSPDFLPLQSTSIACRESRPGPEVGRRRRAISQTLPGYLASDSDNWISVPVLCYETSDSN